MQKREAKFGQLFRHWLRANKDRLPFSCAFELKQTTKNYISFDCLEDHQVEYLEAVQGDSGLLYKAPDDSRGVKPFDYFYLKKAPGFVVIKFPGHFEIITIDTFLHEQRRTKARSLTSQRAREISVISVNLRKDN